MLPELTFDKVKKMTLPQLRALCKELGIENVQGLKKDALIAKVLMNQPVSENTEETKNNKKRKTKSDINTENESQGNNESESKPNETANINEVTDDIENEENFFSNDVCIDYESGSVIEEQNKNQDVDPPIPEENIEKEEEQIEDYEDEAIDSLAETLEEEFDDKSEPSPENVVLTVEENSPTSTQKTQENNSNRSFRPSQNKPKVTEEIDLTDAEIRSGILEINPDGFGFLRANNFRNSDKDTYVANQKIKKYGLRAGDLIRAYCKPIAELKPPALIEPITVNGVPIKSIANRPLFENFVPIYPNEKLRLEVPNKRNDLAVRAIDLIAPIGKGQRALVVSPPKAGKTTLLKMIANSISANNPECKLLVLLIDERPEEVTDMQRNIDGEVIYSTFDEESDNHIKVAELVLARAKRLVEMGQDVVILLDSLTRMARANNVIVPASGKTLSGGVDPVALYFPKRFFGAARNIENGASLTVIATALVDTGSRMDDIVYEEFKGTGNMEIHLDRRLSEKRIFPAIDLLKSGTRREELLLTQKELEGVYNMRRLLSAGDTQEAAESIISLMVRTQTNDELIKCMADYLAKLKKDGFRI